MSPESGVFWREFEIAGRDPIEMAKIDAIAQAAYNVIDAYYLNVFNVEDMEQKVGRAISSSWFVRPWTRPT